MGLRRTTTVVVAAALLGVTGVTRSAVAAATAPRPAAVTRAVRPAPTTAHADFGVFGNYTPIVGDFNGDGYDDIFWYAPGRNASSLWFGHANRQFTAVPETVLGDYAPVVGDLNGDGRSDIIWSSPGDPYPLWLGNADGTFSHHSLYTPGLHYTPIVGDFNGDGRDDIFWDSEARGRDYEAFVDGHGHFALHTSVQVQGEHRVAVGDFNGDGRSDIFFESTDPSQANFFAIAKSDGTFTLHAEDTPATAGIPLSLDVNGDGRDDVVVYGPGTNADWIWYSGTSGLPQRRVFTTINGTYRPVVGDFDGDGHDDIFWYAPGSAPDHIWFDVAHDIPAPTGSQPHEQWEIPHGNSLLLSATVDKSEAYAVFSDGSLHAYSRATGLPLWSHSVDCTASVRRNLDMLLVNCGTATSVYDPATGALRAHYTTHGDASSATDSPYYFTEWLVPPGSSVAHLTIMAVRTGAVVWRTPVTQQSPCALSGDRLMIAPPLETGPGVTEFDVATRRQAFTTSSNVVWSFGPSGYVAMCDDNDDLIGIGPSGQLAWKTDAACEGDDTGFSFERSTVDLDSGADVDIVTGAFLGAFSPFPPIGACCIGRTYSGPFVFGTAHTPASGQCPGPGTESMFLGPYGVSPWLTAAAPAFALEFSLRAIAVERAGVSCSTQDIQAWDERGVIRWTMPADIEPDLARPIGNDMATNGGIESSAIIGINVLDRNLELVDLP